MLYIWKMTPGNRSEKAGKGVGKEGSTNTKAPYQGQYCCSGSPVVVGPLRSVQSPPGLTLRRKVARALTHSSQICLMESCLEWGQAPGITCPALQRTELASAALVSLRTQEASCGHMPGGRVLEGSFPLQPDWNQGWGEGPWCGTQNISYASPWGYYDWVNLCKMPRIIPDLIRLCCDDCNMPGASLALWVCPHEICLQFTKHALFMCQNSDYCHCLGYKGRQGCRFNWKS